VLFGDGKLIGGRRYRGDRLAALRQVTHPRELPLAVVPLLFSFQQALEGVLWLRLSGDGEHSAEISVLSVGFLVFAEFLWPTYAALAVLLVEPDLVAGACSPLSPVSGQFFRSTC